MSNYDGVFICGYYNIHVGCPSSQMASEFQNLLASFDLTQSVNGPTHQHGHTLDLTISHGLFVSVSEIHDTCISDHFPIMFECSVPLSATRSSSPADRRHTITFTTAGEFAAVFLNSSFYTQDKMSSPLCPEDFISDLHSTCSGILDHVAPFRSISTKPKTRPLVD